MKMANTCSFLSVWNGTKQSTHHVLTGVVHVVHVRFDKMTSRHKVCINCLPSREKKQHVWKLHNEIQSFALVFSHTVTWQLWCSHLALPPEPEFSTFGCLGDGFSLVSASDSTAPPSLFPCFHSSGVPCFSVCCFDAFPICTELPSAWAASVLLTWRLWFSRFESERFPFVVSL